MSHITTRVFSQLDLADVFAFRTKHQAREWVARIEAFWAHGIRQQEVSVEYLGKAPLPVGEYLASEVEVTTKLRERRKEEMETTQTSHQSAAGGDYHSQKEESDA